MKNTGHFWRCKKKGECMVKVSVIIPIYNVEKYLKRCLQSVVRQTYVDYEVI